MQKENYDFLKDYSEKATALAIYPMQGEFLKTRKPGKGVYYVCLKLMGECGEFSEKIGKCIRDNAGIIDLDRKAALLLELGDVLWYINALCREFGKKFEDEVDKALKYPASEQDKLIEKKWPTGSGASDDRYFFLSYTMVYYASEIAKCVHLYEPYHPSGDTDHYNIFRCVHEIVASVAIAAHLFGNDLLWVARMNLDKLTSRKKRGKLQGEGDNR